MGGLGGVEVGVPGSMRNISVLVLPAKAVESAAQGVREYGSPAKARACAVSPAKQGRGGVRGVVSTSASGLGREGDCDRKEESNMVAQTNSGATQMNAEGGSLACFQEQQQVRNDHAIARSMQIREDAPRLEDMVRSVVADLQPTPSCQQRQHHLITRLERIFQQLYGHKVQLEVFGSTVCNLAGKSSDLDMTFTPGFPKRLNLSEKKSVLRRVSKALQNNGMRAVPILGARVPIIKIKDHNHTWLSVDLSVENELPVFKSRLLHEYSMIDGRFAQLVLLVKAWAKARQINSAAQGTFNSFGLSLLVVHFLQVSPSPSPSPACTRPFTNGRAVAKGLLPRAAARHMVTTEPGSFGRFFSKIPTCDGRKSSKT